VSFFQALHNLIKNDKITPDMLEVVCAGMVSPEHLALIGKLNLEPIVTHIGYVSHKESVALIQSSDALLLLIESEKGKAASKSFAGSLPAKIFEYLNTGKPILAIIPHGFEYELLQKSNLGFFADPNDPTSVETAIQNLLVSVRSDDNRPQPDWEVIHSFNRKALTEKLAGHMLQLIYQK
jgi:glycosyltransferase involved in cell wall biosynthesis